MKLNHSINFFDAPSQLDVLLFTKHLATMIRAGIPVTEALEALSTHTDSAFFESVIRQILKDVENGQLLSKSFAKHPKIFTPFYVSLIEISEESGTLEENLDFIAKQLAKNHALHKKIQSATLYPSVIFFASIVMGSFIAFFILPQLVDFFSVLNIELPLSTKILLFIAYAFRDFGIFIILGTISFFIGIRMLAKSSFFKPSWDALLLRLPLFGQFNQVSQVAQCTRNLGVLVKSGIPIVRAIDITADTLNNTVFKKSCKMLSNSVAKGNAIGKTLQKPEYAHFPPIVAKMIEVGEKTGNIDDSLLYLADFYEEEIDVLSKNMTTVLEPVLLLVIGLVVGFVALAIITPIYELSGSIRG